MHCFRGVFRKNFSFHLFFSIPWQKDASGVKLQAQRVGSSRKWPYQRKGVFKGSCPRSTSEITWSALRGCSATQTPRKPSIAQLRREATVAKKETPDSHKEDSGENENSYGCEKNGKKKRRCGISRNRGMQAE